MGGVHSDSAEELMVREPSRQSEGIARVLDSGPGDDGGAHSRRDGSLEYIMEVVHMVPLPVIDALEHGVAEVESDVAQLECRRDEGRARSRVGAARGGEPFHSANQICSAYLLFRLNPHSSDGGYRFKPPYCDYNSPLSSHSSLFSSLATYSLPSMAAVPPPMPSLCRPRFLLAMASLLAMLVSSTAVEVTSRRVVAVAGSTGQLGRLVVKELMASNYSVRALARDVSKAKSLLPASEFVEISKCDLGDVSQVARAVKGIDSCIWCASGIVQQATWWDRIISAAKLKLAPTQTLDVEGIAIMAKAIQTLKLEDDGCPRFILCSSAGVTRPEWSDEKKGKLKGAADIPIVRLNPFNVLGLKRQGEDVLRKSGIPYSIVRPCGLSADWPMGRQVLCQGDVAVGRTNRQSLAKLLVRLLDEPLATSKTFESFTLANYPEPLSYADQLSRMLNDGETLDEACIEVEYNLLQQLLPGELLTPQNLAMGQTYEQLDRNETGRLGERGKEKAPIVPR